MPMQNIKHNAIGKQHAKEITELCTSVFTSSEGEDEGKLIGKLAYQLAANIDDKAIFCFGAYSQQLLVGVIFLTHLRLEAQHLVYMLAPVAVRTEYQGKGVGQSLIKHGLAAMKSRSVAVVVTYGDPDYYCKVGFELLPESVIQAPLTLSIPEGWLGCSLSDAPIPVIKERPTCVKAFNDPVYW